VFPGYIDTRGLLVSDWAAAAPARRTEILRAELKLCGKDPANSALQDRLATFYDGLANGSNPQVQTVGPSLDLEAQTYFGQA
jgi:hypothetical protein